MTIIRTKLDKQSKKKVTTGISSLAASCKLRKRGWLQNPNEYNPEAAGMLAATAASSYESLKDCQCLLVDDERVGLGGADLVEVNAHMNPTNSSNQNSSNNSIGSTSHLIRTQDKKVLIVCFRGTKPTDLVDWVTHHLNAGLAEFLNDNDNTEDEDEAQHNSVLVHQGFLDNFHCVWEGSQGVLAYLQDPQLMEENSTQDFQCNNKENDMVRAEATTDTVTHWMDSSKLEAIYITGHGLGGAMALLGGLYLAKMEPELYDKVRGIYTFGQPMVISPKCQNICENLIGDRLFRHVYYNDIVPHLPTMAMGSFTHIGHEYRYRPWRWHEWKEIGWGKCSQLPLGVPIVPFLFGDTVAQAVPLLGVLKSPWSLADHSPALYANTLTHTSDGTGGLMHVVDDIFGHLLPQEDEEEEQPPSLEHIIAKQRSGPTVLPGDDGSDSSDSEVDVAEPTMEERRKIEKPETPEQTRKYGFLWLVHVFVVVLLGSVLTLSSSSSSFALLQNYLKTTPPTSIEAHLPRTYSRQNGRMLVMDRHFEEHHYDLATQPLSVAKTSRFESSSSSSPKNDNKKRPGSKLCCQWVTRRIGKIFHRLRRKRREELLSQS